MDLQILDDQEAEGRVALWAVMGFFQRLRVLHVREQLTSSELVDLFGQIFVWWDEVCFAPLAPADWDSMVQIKYLREELRRSATSEQLATWKDLANKSRERIMAQQPASPESG